MYTPGRFDHISPAPADSHWEPVCMAAAGDAGRITVGSNSNVQDGAVVRTHVTRLGPGQLPGLHPHTVIGNHVTIGHQVSPPSIRRV